MIKGSNEDSAIYFQKKSNTKLPAAHTVGIFKPFQFFDGRNIFNPFGINDAFNSGHHLLFGFGMVEFIKLPLVFFAKRLPSR